MAENYELKSTAVRTVPAPELPYRPPVPKTYRPKIGLIGCGGITKHHLLAAKGLGVEVAAFCDLQIEKARSRRDEFYPSADVYANPAELLAREDIEVVDIATHPEVRVPLIADALNAGKHVLSQKPFVVDLVEGRRLVKLAEAKGRRLAVNQNGRWAPYFSYLRQAVLQGLLGDVQTLNFSLNWDHTWCKGTPFEDVHHLILYDFAIHWFDIAMCVFGGRVPQSVFATAVKAADQEMKPPMLAGALLNFGTGLATLTFNGHSRHGPQERITVSGTRGTLHGSGPICAIDRLVLHTDAGEAVAKLEGGWFPDGFRGSLGELLCAVEENREPLNSAGNNLASLALCFAALRSADSGQPVTPEPIAF